MTPRRLPPPLLLGLLAVVLTSCVGPTPTPGTYREHAAGALAQAGEVAAALELIAEEAAAGALPHHYATVLVREQEERAAWAERAFADRQPPDVADATRERVLALLDRALAQAERARVMVDRGDLPGFGSLAATYGALDDDLGAVEAELRSPFGPGAAQ